MKYLWQELDKITPKLEQKSPKVLFLDFDGTLTPIVKSPKEARLSLKTKNLLQKLSTKKDVYLIIISGRKLEDIKSKIKLPNIIYAGNHGLEGEIFDQYYSFPIPDKIAVILKSIRKLLDKIADQFTGVFIENKGTTLSFHYRLANKQQIPDIKVLFEKTLQPYIKNESISILSGKMVFDVMPKIHWNKGSFAKLAVDKIRARAKITPLVISIGDDATDEEIFRKIDQGITIKVGREQKSNAKYLLNNTKDVFKFLGWVNTRI